MAMKQIPDLRKVDTTAKKAAAPKATAKILDKIEHDGKVYRRVDLDNNFSMLSKKVARPVIQKIMNYTAQYMGVDNIEALLSPPKEGVQTIDIRDDKGNIHKVPKHQIESYARMTLEVTDVDFESELLALLYIDDGEPYFCMESYAERVKAFDNLPDKYDDNTREAILDFFDRKLKSIMRGSQTCLAAAIAKAAEIQ